MQTPDELKYTAEHEWVGRDGGMAKVGITDYAQGELGDIVFLELPQPGAQVKQGAVMGTIEAVKTVSDLYAPVSGKVVAVNPALTDKPELVNKSPYGEGWMIQIEMANPKELDALLDARGYAAHVGGGH